MIKKMLCLVIFLLPLSITQAADNLKAFPTAEPGMQRFVLNLPAREDESLFKVELLVGKQMEIDERNRYFFAGQIDQEIIKGWGFPSYVVKHLGPMAGTMMAVDPALPRVKRFITLGGDPFLIRYNSRLPIVIYVPEGAEVRYRLWSAQPAMEVMSQG